MRERSWNKRLGKSGQKAAHATLEAALTARLLPRRRIRCGAAGARTLGFQEVGNEEILKSCYTLVQRFRCREEPMRGEEF